eukprot:3151225-Pyramimonas_sp.AAC.1
MRLEDSVRRFCRDRGLGEWQLLAGDADHWASLTADFLSYSDFTSLLSHGGGVGDGCGGDGVVVIAMAPVVPIFKMMAVMVLSL